MAKPPPFAAAAAKGPKGKAAAVKKPAGKKPPPFQKGKPPFPPEGA